MSESTKDKYQTFTNSNWSIALMPFALVVMDE